HDHPRPEIVQQRTGERQPPTHVLERVVAHQPYVADGTLDLSLLPAIGPGERPDGGLEPGHAIALRVEDALQDLVHLHRLALAAAAGGQRRQHHREDAESERDQDQPAERFGREGHRRERSERATDLRIPASAEVYNQRPRDRTRIARRKPTGCVSPTSIASLGSRVTPPSEHSSMPAPTSIRCGPIWLRCRSSRSSWSSTRSTSAGYERCAPAFGHRGPPG